MLNGYSQRPEKAPVKVSSSIMAERNSSNLVKTFEYLSDRQPDTADVLIKIKHPTDMDALSEHWGEKKKKNNCNHTGMFSGEFLTWVILFKLIF